MNNPALQYPVAPIARKKIYLTINQCFVPKFWASAMLLTTTALSQTLLAAEADTSTNINVEAVSVTGNPLGLSADELAVPVTVLNGRELSLRRESTIGETLNGIPGVSATGFGPNVARPIIRGLDAERVRILQNGVGVLDASSLSFDHAVSVDPLVVEQIDVVRGPAALLYGGSAVGGVVNSTDNRIPKEQINGVTGRYEARLGGADDQRNGAVVVDAGNGDFAIHADAYQRKTNDLSIPGYAVSNRKNAADGTLQINRGRLVNSDSNDDGGAFGASATFDKGYVGFSYARTNNDYGTVAEPGVHIDMHSDRVELASEFKDLGVFTSNTINRVKGRLAYTDYIHREINAGVVGTTFKNNGLEGAFELGHEKIGNMQGVIGLQFQNTTFEALGDEAFVPRNTTVSQGIYIFEELPLTGLPIEFLADYLAPLKLSFGGRLDNVDLNSAGGGRFGAPLTKNYRPNSYALGGIYTLSSNWSLASNLSHNERAPASFEVFANGPHLATGQYEIGDTNLSKERANGIDGQIRWKSGKDSFNFGAYYTKFNNYIGLFNTANKRGVDGELNPVDANGDGIADGSGEDIVPEAQFIAVPAVFKGLEMEGKFGIANNFALTARGDYVHATNSNTGEYLPRIAPLRLGTGLEYQLNSWTARLDVLHAFKQNHTDQFELPTNGYTNVSALVAYKLPTKMHMEIFAKASNLLNQEIREATSVLKDISPAGERSVLVGLRGDF